MIRQEQMQVVNQQQIADEHFRANINWTTRTGI